MPKTLIVALTPRGKKLANSIQQLWPAYDVVYKPKPFTALVQKAFLRGNRMLLICATGIAVRTLAPVLQDKYRDPPVLVLDERGQYVIPLLSGHEGGANDWAQTVAKKLQAHNVMTTAKSYVEPVYTVGMGCERHCSCEHLGALLSECVRDIGVSLDQVVCLASIDIKSDEVGLIELAERLNKPFRTWPASSLQMMEPLLSTRSEYVFKTVGVYGVAESAALLAAQNEAGESPELIFTKRKTAKATCAIARAYPYVEMSNVQ